MYSAYSHAITHTHTVRVACSMSPYCHLAFLRQHFSPDTFVRMQHWIFPPVFFFKKITSRNIFTTRPSSELNTTKQYEKLWELTSSVWPVLEGWGKQSESVKKVFGNLIEFFLGGGDLNQSLHTPTRPLNSTSRPSAALLHCQFSLPRSILQCIFSWSFCSESLHGFLDITGEDVRKLVCLKINKTKEEGVHREWLIKIHTYITSLVYLQLWLWQPASPLATHAVNSSCEITGRIKGQRQTLWQWLLIHRRQYALLLIHFIYWTLAE